MGHAGKVEALKAKDPLYALRHSAAHVMAQAVRRLYPQAKLAIGPPIEDGFYYDFDLGRPFTPEDIEKIERRMKEQLADFTTLLRAGTIAQARQFLRLLPCPILFMPCVDDGYRIENYVRSIGAGVAPETIAPAIRNCELEIARLEARIRTPRQQPQIEKLRDALTQRAAEWRITLRSEPKVARLLLRRLVGPLVMLDESTRPDFIKADCEVKTGLIDGLAEIQDVASPTGFEPVF